MTFQPRMKSKNCRKSGFFRDLRLYVTKYVKFKFEAVLKGSTPFTRSINSTVLNSNLQMKHFLNCLLSVLLYVILYVTFQTKNRFPPQRGKTEKSFNFFLNRGEIFYLKRPIESRERPRRPNSSISMRGSSLLRPSRSPLRKRSRSS